MSGLLFLAAVASFLVIVWWAYGVDTAADASGEQGWLAMRPPSGAKRQERSHGWRRTLAAARGPGLRGTRRGWRRARR